MYSSETKLRSVPPYTYNVEYVPHTFLYVPNAQFTIQLKPSQKTINYIFQYCEIWRLQWKRNKNFITKNFVLLPGLAMRDLNRGR
jgi:hypothetical protein